MKPRVLHVGKFYPPDYRGGIETYTQDLCCALREQVDFRVVVSSDRGAGAEETVDGIPVLRLPTVAKPASAPISPQLRRILRAPQADLLHFHLPHPAAVLAWLAAGEEARRLPVIATYHSDIVRQKFLGALFEPFHQKFLRRCAAIIVSSRDYLQSSPPLQPHRERCHVVPFGIDARGWEPRDSAAVDAIRRKYGPHMVLAIGRLIYYKGFEFLIRGFRDVPGKLVIIGEGPLRAQLQRLVQRLGLSHRVYLVGRVERVADYLHACDLFVLPSIARSEAFGIVQLEAMACGKPVVNTRLQSGVPFVSREGESGFTVPPANPAALARAINRLLGDEALRKRFGEAGQERVRREFSLEHMAQATFAVYQRVLGIAAHTAVPL